MGSKRTGNGDPIPDATPTKLDKILKKAHGNQKITRAVADGAVGRRVKAQQKKTDPKDIKDPKH